MFFVWTVSKISKLLNMLSRYNTGFLVLVLARKHPFKNVMLKSPGRFMRTMSEAVCCQWVWRLTLMGAECLISKHGNSMYDYIRYAA